MADRTNLKIADAADLADDDPFAELTRIMGFDPREPAKLTPAAKLGPVVNPGQPQRSEPAQLDDFFGAQEPEAAAAAPHDDILDGLMVANDAAADENLQADFSIDLEQELIGGLDFDDLAAHDSYADGPYEDEPATESYAAQPQAASYGVEPAVETPHYRDEPQFDADFELADNLDDALVEVVGDEPEPEAQWQQRAGARDFNDLIGSTAPAVESPLTAEDEQAAFDREVNARFEMLGDMDFDFGDKPIEQEAAAAVEANVSSEVEAPDTDEAPDFVLHEDELRLDEDFQFDIEPETAATDHIEAEPVAAYVEQSAPVAEYAVAAEPVDHGFAPETGYADTAYEPVEPLADENGDYALEAASYEPFEADTYADDDADGYEPVAPEPAYEPVSPESAYDQAPLEPVYEEVEPAAPAYAAPVYQRASYSSPSSYGLGAATRSAPSAAMPVAAAPASVPEEDFEFTLEDELNALLGNTVAVPAAPPIHAEPAEIEAPESLSWSARDEALQAAAAIDAADPAGQDDVDFAPAVTDYALPAEEIDEDLVDFDQEAFDAAIAKGFDGDDLDMFADHEAHAPPVQEVPMPAADRATPKVDPLQTIEALTAQYSAPSGRASYRGAAYEDVPDIETIDVSDRAVALADDLDIPEIPQHEEFPPISAYDDLDSEFAGLLNDMNTAEQAQRPAASSNPPFADRTAAPSYDYAAAAASVAAISAATMPQTGARPVYNEAQSPSAGFDFPETRTDARTPTDSPYNANAFNYDAQLDEEMSIPSDHLAEERPRSRRGMMIAAIVGGVAILGGIGAFALSFGDGSGSASAPVVVKADDSPIKVRPTNPGGSSVPNQENKVYDAVRGTDANGAPQQEKLVTTAEEPVDMTPPAIEEEIAAADDEPAVSGAPKGEDRIEQIVNDAAADSDAEVAAVAPRKVRTMVVRPDGTLVPREDPAPVAAQAAQPEAPMEVAATETAPPTMRVVEPDSTGTVAEQPAAAALEPAAPVAEAPAQPEAPAAQSSTTPEVVPVAPQRPSEQPVEVVGEVKADQVAALAPAAAAAGSWSMQIASQPSEAAAKSSYQDLQRRYGAVLNGRQANIVKAEIAGKGTFWRVRVPANSRNDAISLCESYKAAGGNCFVSR